MFHGIGKDSIYKIIPGDWELHDKFRRVKIAIPKKSENIESIVERIKSHSRVLCVVNTRSFASKIFNLLPSNESNVHLSRMMCPTHIADTIASIKRILKTTANPIRVVSTRLIEAGVDIDFPVVFRQLSGLDSIVQAAGRCNREGLLPEATTYVFDVGGERSYGSTASAINAMREMMSIKQDADWLSPATMTEYYRILYSKTASFDKQGIESRTNSLGEIAYEDIAKRFRLIDEEGIPVIVNYGKSPSLVARLKDEGPSRTLMRQLSLFTVTVRKRLFDGLRNAGLITEPRNGIYYIGLKEQYDSKTGLNTINEYTEQIYII